MRRLTTILFSSFLVLTLAGSAGALTIVPNPVHHERSSGAGSPLDADVYLVDVSGDTMTFQLSVTTGSVDEIDVMMLTMFLPDPPYYDFNYIVDAGTNPGTGDVTVVPGVEPDFIEFVYPGGTKAEFRFDDENDKVDAGETSDEFWLVFENPISSDWTGGISFDAGGSVLPSETFDTVPEPSTSLLMLLAAGVGLVVTRSRF